jgi:diaminopimelate epimerase
MSTLSLPIVKYEGTGNDFIIIDEWDGEVVPEEDKARLAEKLCRRSGSIGADGVLFWSRSHKASGRMRTFNADGSEAEICGNGLRCVARYAYEKRQIGATTLTVETMKAVSELSLLLDDSGAVDRIRVLIGEPDFMAKDIPMAGRPDRRVIDEDFFVDDAIGTIKITALSVGNPHVVHFVKDLEKTDVVRLGSVIERHPTFPNRTNVNFVQVESPKGFRIKTFERGVGPTLSCGTGVVASTIAGAVTGRLRFNTEVAAATEGGSLASECRQRGDTIRAYLIGPARRVFSGKTTVEITAGGVSYPGGAAIYDVED